MNPFPWSSDFRHAPFIAALMLFVFGGPAQAQKADQPVTRVGDEWRFAVYYSVPSAAPNQMAHAIVKREHHNPYLGSSTVELVGYRLGR
jgi:hypothetical protein